MLPSIHSSLVNSFRQLGVLVEEVSVKDVMESPGLVCLWPKRREPEAVLALDMGADPKFAQHLRDLQGVMAIPWVFWFLDHPEGYGFPDSCDPNWTMAFCWDRALSKLFSHHGPLPVTHLPLASDPSVFHPQRRPEQKRFPGGVFVGSTCHPNPFLEEVARTCSHIRDAAQALWSIHKTHMEIPMEETAWQQAESLGGKPQEQIRRDPLWRLWVKSCLHKAGRMKRVEVVEKVLGSQGVVFGDPGWEELLGQVPYLGPVRYGPQLREVYLNSSFVLELRQPQSHGGLSQRIFDASLCGRPIVAEWSAELEEILGGPHRVLAFRSLDEAMEAKTRCLDFPAEVSQMARLARKEVLSRHTFLHRAHLILSHMMAELG